MHNCQVLAALPGLKHACMAGSRVAEQVKSGQHSEGDDITGRSVSHMHGLKQRDWQFCNKHAHIAVHDASQEARVLGKRESGEIQAISSTGPRERALVRVIWKGASWNRCRGDQRLRRREEPQTSIGLRIDRCLEYPVRVTLTPCISTED